jgi:hypothetical protein
MQAKTGCPAETRPPLPPARLARQPFCCDDAFPADADGWRALKRYIVRMKDGLDLARIEVRSRPLTEDLARTIERHLEFGLAEPTKR